MYIALTRAQQASEELADILSSVAGGGHRCFIAPMLEIEFLRPACDFEGVGAIVMTSANGVLAAQELEAIAQAKELSLYCVGARTGQMAEALGWRTVAGVGQDISELRRVLADAAIVGRVIYLAGVDRAGVLDVEIVEVYRARKIDAFSVDFLIGFADIDAVTLFSARTAAIFLGLIEATELGDALRQKVIYCLSEPIADTVRAAGYDQVFAPKMPTRAALIDLINS